jgi:hypothetical protein
MLVSTTPTGQMSKHAVGIDLGHLLCMQSTSLAAVPHGLAMSACMRLLLRTTTHKCNLRLAMSMLQVLRRVPKQAMSLACSRARCRCWQHI